MGLNQVNLHGRLVRDVELKYTGNGTALLNNAIAVERDFKNKQTGERETDFINITVFSKTAEVISKYFKKGDGIIVNGRIQTNNYQDKEGNNRTSVDVVVNGFDFPLSSKGNQQGGDNQNFNNQPNDPFADDSITITDNELPF